MLVILEGCDGVGKTTLAQGLANILTAEVIHCNRTTPNNHSFFTEIIEASKHKNIIADRFMYGQFVYQTLYERALSTASLHSLEMQLLVNGGKVIYVYASPKVIAKRLEARDEKTSLPIEQICARFEQLFHNSMLPVIAWNTNPTIEHAKNKTTVLF